MMQNILIRLKKIRFFKVWSGDFVDKQGDVKSGATFSISIGHHTIPALITLFTDREKQGVFVRLL